MANTITDFLHNYKVRLMENLSPPVLTATVEGTAGSTSYSYKASFLTIVGESLACDTVTVTNGNATLSGFNKVRLSLQDIPPSVRYIRFWKLVGQTWKKIADVAADPGQLYDTGQATTTATLPTTNTSGRPDVIAICAKPGTLAQRISWMDLQSIMYTTNEKLWGTVFRAGDVVRGGKETRVTGPFRQDSTEYSVGDIVTVDSSSQFRYECTAAGTSASTVPTGWPAAIGETKTDGDVEWTTICDWVFTEGEVYLFGTILDIAASDRLHLTGSGTEVVGLTVTPVFTTPDDDIVQRAGIDEGVPQESANKGPDWLYLTLTWGIDVLGQVVIKRFIDGVPDTVTLATERTELDIELARQRFDTSGDFVVDKFPMKVFDHPTDNDKLMLHVNRGKAYPRGYEVQFDGTRKIEFNRSRETKFVNGSTLDVFNSSGGSVTGTIEGPFNVNGKSLKFKVGTGAFHTVALTSTGADQTASDVGDQIVADLTSNGYEGLVTYSTSADDKIFQLKAKNGFSLTVAAVGSNEAYSVLGLALGTYEPAGTRIYAIEQFFVKDTSDVTYKTEDVIQMTRSNISDYDGVEDLTSIVGVSSSSNDCKDGKYNYTSGVDYQRSVIQGVGVCIDWSLGGSEPTGGATYYAKVKRNYEPVKGIRQLCRCVDAKVVKGAEDGKDTLTFTDATSITRIAINPATGDSYGTTVAPTGSPKEVINILRVNNSAGQSSDQYSLYSLLTNSGALTHEASEIDWADAGTPGQSGTGQPAGSVTYYVTFDFWYHVLEGDFVTADSYDSYPDIPIYNSSTYLRDCVDFRTTGTWPAYNEDVTFDFNYYLSRIDKLTLDEWGNFRLVTGSSALNPPTPSDQSGIQSLAVLRIPPYTYDKSDVKIVSLEVMRLTQRQLQNMAERLTRMEYWATVNDLEKEANNKTIYGAVGGDAVVAEKQGIFTDSLTGFGRCDLQFDKNGVAFSVAIDILERQVMLQADQDMQVIEVDLDNSVHVRRAGNSILLDYQPVLIEEQPYAGITVNGAFDFVVNNYYGHLRINPEVDVFVDAAQLPSVNVDFDNNFSALLNNLPPEVVTKVNWNSYIGNGAGLDFSDAMWSSMSGRTFSQHGLIIHADGSVESSDWGISREGDTYRNLRGMGGGTFSATRTGTSTSLVPGSITQSLGNRVVDLSLQGNMRAGVEISVDATGLLPNVDHALTMNGIACDLTYDSVPTNHSGAQGSHTYSGKTTVTTSNDGTLTATFLVPSGIPVGNADIKIFYYADPDISCASSSYYTAGFTQHNQETTLGFQTLKTVTTNLTESASFSVAGGDPLAQSFTLKRPTYVSEIHLPFATKDASKGFVVQIRNMVNGFPGQTIFASSRKASADIEVSSDSSVWTAFVFNKVLQYSANTEYCFVAMPEGNNTGYNLYAAELSTVDMLTAMRINTQAASGVLFHSPNSSTWEPWTKRDLKYRIFESNFENDCQIHWSNITGVQASILVLAVEEFLGPGTNAVWSYSLDQGSSWTPFKPQIDTDLGEIITQVQLRVDVTSIGGSYQVIDKFAGILLRYHNATGYYIGNDEIFSDPLTYPNKITVYVDLDTDGTNGSGTRCVTPLGSIDDGTSWFSIPLKVGYTPVVASREPFFTYHFETPDEATITDATNAEPIVVSSAAHGFTDNMVVTISAVGGNTAANDDWVVTNSTDDTFELYSTLGVASVGNGAYTTGGTIVMREFSQVREALKFETSNRALTPKGMNISFIEARVE